MQFHHYDPVPRNIADEIMTKRMILVPSAMAVPGIGPGSSRPSVHHRRRARSVHRA